MSTEKTPQTTVPEDLSDRIWSLAFRHKPLWAIGIISTLLHTTSGNQLIYPYTKLTSFPEFPFQFFNLIVLLDIPRVGIATWLSNRAYPLLLTIGLALLLWCVHFMAQAGLIRAGHEFAQGRQPNFKQYQNKLLSRDWLQLLLLNLLLFGLFYFTVLLGIWLFRPALYPTLESEWQMVQQYDSWPYHILGFILAWILVPANLIALLIYPFAKRSVVLGNRGIIASLKHAIRLMWLNLWNTAGVLAYAGVVYFAMTALVVALFYLASILGLVDLALLAQGNIMSLPVLSLMLLAIVIGGYVMAAVSLFVTAYYVKFEEKHQENLPL